jgi:micrococcal nuclease
LVIALLALLGCAKAVDSDPASTAPRAGAAQAPSEPEASVDELEPPPAVDASADEANEERTQRGSPQRAPRPSAKAGNTLHQVVRVIDGDTIQVDVDGELERVRYIGMDTPETVHPRKPVECFGKEASARNAALVGDKKVRLERDVTDRDRYGRLLRYVWVDDTFVNLELVREGYAMVSTYPPDVEHTDAFVAAQREAREANRGLWRSCPARAEAARREEAPKPKAPSQGPKGCPIKGNINARGDKIYHRPDCPSYARTKIDEDAGQRWFCSDGEAEAAGWRVAKNCP